MSTISKIQTDSNWGTEANKINQNFTNLNTDIVKLQNTAGIKIPLFSSVSAATASITSPYEGQLILVGSTLPAPVYRWNGSSWANTGVTGGSSSTALTDYYTKSEVNTLQNEKLSVSSLASGRGESTTTAMTQAAVTQELAAQDEKLTELSSNYNEVQLTNSDFRVISENSDKSTVSLSNVTRISINNLRASFIGTAEQQEYELNNFEAIYVDISNLPRGSYEEAEFSLPVLKANYTTLDYLSNIIILAYRNTRLCGGILFDDYLKKINNEVYLSCEKKLKKEDYSTYSTILMEGSVRLFFSLSRSRYINSEGNNRSITLNNFEVAYIDISDFKIYSVGSPEELVNIKIEKYSSIDLSSKDKIILAYRDGIRLVGGILLDCMAQKSNDCFVITADKSIVITDDSSLSYVDLKKPVRIFCNGGNFYISGNEEKRISIANFEVAYIDVNSIGKNSVENPAEILVTKYSSNFDYYDKIVLLYRDGSRVIGGLLYSHVMNDMIRLARTDIDNLIVDISAEFIDGYYINTNGSLYETSSGYQYSKPIYMKKGEMIIVSCQSSTQNSVISVTLENGDSYESVVAGVSGKYRYSYIAPEDCYVAISWLTKETNKIQKLSFTLNDGSSNNKETYFKKNINFTPMSSCNKEGILVYEGDTKSNGNYIVNAISYPNGEIIACRNGGSIVRIGIDGTEQELLNIPTASDWRGLWMDSNLNVYVSPHASPIGSINVEHRGIYRLAYGKESFVKVLDLYNPESPITTETNDNDDTIWTFCEDKEGCIYAGVYAHLVRPNPSVYKSEDGGLTWKHIVNFNDAGLTKNGRHIHAIIYNKYNDSLYVIVGEINTIFKSVDGGANWIDLNIQLVVKGSSMIATENGLIIGSDGAFHCDVDIVYPDDINHKTVSRIWANTVFAIRESDITGYLYAFTKIDSSVLSISVYPPIEAIDSDESLQSWKDTTDAATVKMWQEYHDSIAKAFPEDAVRPQHFSILISKDRGMSWQILYKEFCGSTQPAGLWTIGYFRNGECLAGRLDSSRNFTNPLIISEGRKKYINGKIDLTGDVLIKTNKSTLIDC